MTTDTDHAARRQSAFDARVRWYKENPSFDHVHSFVRTSINGLFDELAYCSDSTVDEYSNEIDAAIDLQLAREWTIDMFDDDDGERRSNIAEFLRYATIHATLNTRELEMLKYMSEYRDLALFTADDEMRAKYDLPSLDGADQYDTDVIVNAILRKITAL